MVVRLLSPLSPGHYTLQIYYASLVRKDLMGCYLSYSNGYPFVLTQFEPNYARTFLPTFDEPNIKLVFELTIISPSNFSLFFNTPIQSSTPFTLQSRQGHLLAYQSTTFAPTPLMSAYLLALAIGPYQSLYSSQIPYTDISLHFPRCPHDSCS